MIDVLVAMARSCSAAGLCSSNSTR